MEITKKFSLPLFKKTEKALLSLLPYAQEILCEGVDLDYIAYQHNVPREPLAQAVELLIQLSNSPAIAKKAFITAHELSRRSGVSGQKIRIMIDAKELPGKVIIYGKKNSYLIAVPTANEFIKKHKNRPAFQRSKTYETFPLAKFAAGINQTFIQGRFRTTAWMRPAFLVFVEGYTVPEAAHSTDTSYDLIRGSIKKLNDTIQKLAPEDIHEMEQFLGSVTHIDTVLNVLFQRWTEHKKTRRVMYDSSTRKHLAVQKLSKLHSL